TGFLRRARPFEETVPITLLAPLIVVYSPYRDVRRRLQRARQSTRVLHLDTCGSLPIRDCIFACKHLTPFGCCSSSFQPRRGSRQFTAPLLAQPDLSREKS